MLKFVLAAVVIGFGSLPALARPPSLSSYAWYPTRAGLTQQTFEADKERCALLSLAMGATPQAMAAAIPHIVRLHGGSRLGPGRGN